MGRFYEHHEEILAGGYPAIHDKLKAFIRSEDIRNKSVLDAGACTGSFGLWAAANGASKVVINEARRAWAEQAQEYAVRHSEVHGFDLSTVTVDNRKVDMSYNIGWNAQTLIARRFLYELRDDDVRRKFANECRNAGITVVYAQGLVRVKNHKEPLWNVVLETDMFREAGYKVTDYNDNDLMRLELDV